MKIIYKNKEIKINTIEELETIKELETNWKNTLIAIYKCRVVLKRSTF